MFTTREARRLGTGARGVFRYRTRAALIAVALSTGLALTAWADPPEPPPAPGTKPYDLYIRSEGDPNSWLRPTFRMDAGMWWQKNPWAGNSRELLGDNPARWGEFGIVPGLEGQLALREAGAVYGRVSGVYATSGWGMDAAGSNFGDNHVGEWTLEDAYAGWTSGEMFPSLGTNAIDISIGAQKYQAGTGFLVSDGGSDGAERGGYWLGLRKAFRFTAIAKLRTGPWLAEAMFFRPNDDKNTSTKTVGTNVEYTFGETGKLAGSYWNVYSSNNARRDGLNIFDVRGEVHPAKSLPGLLLEGELTYERNGSGSLNNSWGGFGGIGYAFGDDMPASPFVSYRYVYFSGDDGSGDNRAFDPLFYGFTDWNQWYLGEIIGEYVATNRNATVHILRLKTQPVEAITAQLFYLYYRLNEDREGTITPRPPTSERLALIDDRSIGQELDLVIDFTVTDNLAFSGVAAVFFPGAGAKDFFADDNTWMSFMLYTSINF